MQKEKGQIFIEQEARMFSPKKLQAEPDMEFGERLGEIRRSRKVTQEQLAEKIGKTQKTVQNYEGGHTRPNMNTFLKIMTVLHATDEEKATLLSLTDYSAQAEEMDCVEPSTDNRNYLCDAFEGQRYRCFFISNHRDSKLDVIEIEELHARNQESLSAEATVRKRKYTCKVIPSAEGSYAFFSLASKNVLYIDRCLMILPRNKKIRKRFDVGIAAILSLATQSDDDNFFPSFQLCAIVSDKYYEQIKDEAGFRSECLSELELPKGDNSYHIHLRDIKERSDRFYHKVQAMVDTD